MSEMHVVDYKIYGDDMQFVEIELDPEEAVVAEAGAMMYMDPAIEMETIFGDGSSRGGGGLMGALMSAGKRVLTGESLFMTVFVNKGRGKKRVAFAAPFPGSIVAVKLGEVGGNLVVQKDAFLAAAKGVSIGIAFQKKLGARASSAARASSCSASKATAWPSFTPAARCTSEPSRPVRRSASTRAVSSASRPTSATTFSTSERSSRRCSAARGSSSPR